MRIPEDQGARIKETMHTLGYLWGLGRPIRLSELGRALRIGPTDPVTTVASWVSERHKCPGMAWVAMDMMLLGALPPDGLSKIITHHKVRLSRPDRKGKRLGEKSRVEPIQHVE